ncbi:putative membrane transporter [Methylocella silvestris BL2]|uniref:Putative membrane transporter n=1 Tax=Methylocella silvestris (strain DSM 15510 / CIP 108128 / LMG 27833 / NCIMB 13906 / BL2) TaxID=395965 RepID=B8EL65_METSB|nr:MMPL family transporter [Methylocella silvestris]ACK49060.1 putative membrane transporter [Methylocella silvestris BL2]
MTDQGQKEHAADLNLASSSVGKRAGLALGIERTGLISLRYPLFVALAALALVIAAGFGLTRLKVDDSLSQLFRSNTPEFRQYEEVTRKFPSSEYDVLAVIEGPSLLERDSLDKLRNFVTDVQLIDGVQGVISLYSARQPPENGDTPAPLFPDPLPEGAAYDALVKRVMSNEIIRGKILSEDGQLTLVVLALDPKIVGGKGLDAAVGEIRKTMAEDLDRTGLKAELSGVPVMQLEIRTAVERDRLVYNATGFIAGCLIAILFFRRLSFMVIAAGPPLLAIILALGTLGWLDFRLNMFLNVMTPLIMVISFSDSMQLTFATRDRILAGQSKQEALRNAILIVGPACVLTHATAALSFVALLFSDSELIRTFGEAGLIATLIALFTVLLLLPLLGMLLLRNEARLAATGRRGDLGVEALRAFCFWIAARMVRHPGLYSLVGLIVVAALGAVFGNLEPRYRLADQVPDKEQAVSASGRLDAKLTGANPIDVLIEFPQGASLYAPETLAVIAKTHSLLEHQKGVGNVWSLETLRRWLQDKMGASDVGTLKKYVDLLPEHLTQRFIDAKRDAVVVSGRVPDADASKLLPVVDAVDQSLQSLRAAYPGYTISVTGLSAIAARNSASMIDKLTRGLTIEFFFVAAFIGLAFRSVVVGLACVLPGIFPVVASGALLAITGQGLQFASVVALTVSFGLGLSATIHFLNRLRIEGDSGENYALAVEQATVLVGPALILTSIVLACGLAVTVFSDLPSLRLFGWLSAFAMMAALTADLLILRPTAMFLHSAAERLAAWRRGGAAGAAPR